MKQVPKSLLTLLSASLLLTACQTKTSQTFVSQPAAPKQEVTLPSQNKVENKPVTKTPAEKVETVASQAPVNQTADTVVKANQTELVTSTETVSPQETVTSYEPLPENISILNSQVEEGAPDWVVTPENYPASDLPTLTLATGETLVWAEDSPTNKPVVAMPEHLVGKWVYQNDISIATLTISPDGQYHNHINYPNWETVHEYTGTLNQFVVESDGLYRAFDGSAAYIVPATGFGGYFVKYDTGYSLLSDNEIAIHMWQMSGTQDRTTYDYVANQNFTWNMTRVTE